MSPEDLHVALLEHALANGDEPLAALVVRAARVRVSPQAAAPAWRAYRVLVDALGLAEHRDGHG